MEEKDRYLLLELIMTGLLLLSLFLLFGGNLVLYRLVSIFIIALGFFFSWQMRSGSYPWLGSLVVLTVIGVAFWMVYSFLASSLLYKEVIVICVKGLFFLLAALSFHVFDASYMNYVQLLSIPLFLCTPLVIESYADPLVILFNSLYLVGWLFILRLKFFKFFRKPTGEILQNFKYTALPIIVTLCIGLLFSGLMVFNLPLKKMTAGGLFRFEGEGGQESLSELEESYYELENQLLNKLPENIPVQETTENKFALLGMLDYLLKESSTIMEVDRADLGLVSYFKTPGPGLEKGEGEEVLVLLKSYTDIKTEIKQRQIKQEMLDSFKNPLLVKQRYDVRNAIEQLEKSSSPAELAQNLKDLQALIRRSSLEKEAKEELQRLSRELADWKKYEIDRQNIQAPQPEPETQDQAEQEEELAAPKIVETKLEPPPPEEELPKETPQLSRKRFKLWPVFPARAILRVSFWLSAVSFFMVILCFIVFSMMVLKRKTSLKTLSRNDPRLFIISAYDNLKEVLKEFGVEYNQQMLPLVFARNVEKKYSINEGVFSSFVYRYEEAKFSVRHVPVQADALEFLKQYNDFLNIASSSQKSSRVLLRRCLLMLKRKPFFI